MEQLAIITSSKDEGLIVVDINTGTTVSIFKNCLCDSSCACIISSDLSFSGRGLAGDYIAISQSKKPVIHIYQWNKSQPHMVCHIQEITTALTSDSSGTYIYGGTKGGRIHCWELSTGNLLQSWQAHFKTVTRIGVTCCGMYLMSCSEDGMVRVWLTASIIGGHSVIGGGAPASTSVSPYRSWSAHSLPVRDLRVLGAGQSLRVMSCSLDTALTTFDVPANKQCSSLYLPSSLEALAVNTSEDMAFAGSSSGLIYLIDLSAVASHVSKAHKTCSSSVQCSPTQSSPPSLPEGVSALEGHTARVSSLSTSIDNNLLVSASVDGTVCVWDVWSRQCLRDLSPLNKSPLSCVLVIPRPDVLNTDVHRPFLSPLGHLKKYATETSLATGPLLLRTTCQPSQPCSGARSSPDSVCTAAGNISTTTGGTSQSHDEHTTSAERMRGVEDVSRGMCPDMFGVVKLPESDDMNFLKSESLQSPSVFRSLRHTAEATETETTATSQETFHKSVMQPDQLKCSSTNESSTHKRHRVDDNKTIKDVVKQSRSQVSESNMIIPEQEKKEENDKNTDVTLSSGKSSSRKPLRLKSRKKK